MIDNFSEQASAVHLHLSSFEDNNVNILAREDRWLKKRVK